MNKSTIFAKKSASFLKKNENIISQIKEALVLKGIFSKTSCVCVYLKAKFYVAIIILEGFREG